MINKEICAAYEELLFEYAEYGASDGGAEKYKELTAHLRECEACRAELDEYRQMLSAVKASAMSAPSELRVGVMSSVSADAKRRRRARFVRRAGGVAAALVLAVGVYAAVASGTLGRGVNSASDGMAPDMDAPNADADEDMSLSGGANAEGEEDKNADVENSGDIDMEDGEYDPSSPDIDTGADKPETSGSGIISDGEIPEKAKVYFENATADGGYDGGVCVMLTGGDASKALARLADMFGLTLDENVAVLEYEHLKKLTSVLLDLESEMKDLDAVGYEIDTDEDEDKCIVIFAS